METIKKMLAFLKSKPETMVAEDHLEDDCLISVIIPAYNEGKTIVNTLRHVLKPNDPNVEIILADGGSTDNTKTLAAKHGVTVLDSPPGRAACQNFGAKKSKGDILLFLHSDTLLPPNWNDLIRNSLQNPKVLVSCFKFQVNERLTLISAVEYLTNIRSKYKKLPYGDQALHMRKSVFDRLGGFPAQEFMEDFSLMKKVRKLGDVHTIDVPATTSARRWMKNGVVYTTTFNQFVIVGYNLGISAEDLRKLYYDPKDQPKKKK